MTFSLSNRPESNIRVTLVPIRTTLACTVIDSSGSNFLSFLIPQQLRQRRLDFGGGRHDGVEEGVVAGRGHVFGGDAQDRGVEVLEDVLADLGGEFGPEAAGAG